MRMGLGAGTNCGTVAVALLLAWAANAQAVTGGAPPLAAGTTQAAAGGAPAMTTASAATDAAPAGGAPGGGMPPGAAPAGSAPGGGLPPTAPAGGTAAGAAPGVAAGGTPAPPPAVAPAPSAAPYVPPEPVYENIQRKPLPAFMVPLAAKTLMLGVARAGSELVAVGAHGDIVRSSDAGKTWTQVPSPVRELLTAVTFANANDGWAVGHDAVILGTTDGGKTWAVQHFDPKLQAPFLNVYFADAEHGFAMGAFGLLMQTHDGGRTWLDVPADNIRSEQLNFYSMVRLGNGDLLLVGEQGLVDVSDDAGMTWRVLKSPWKGTLFGALAVGDKGALVFGLRGRAFMTGDVDSGEWRQVPTQTTASFYGGAQQPDGRFVLVGAAGTILSVAPDGASVEVVKSPSSQDYSAVLPVAGQLVLAGMRGLQRAALAAGVTKDGGD